MLSFGILCVVGVWAAQPQVSTRDIVRTHVNADGGVNHEIAAQTGWNTVHAFRWKLLLVDKTTGKANPAGADRVFRTGDEFKLHIQALTTLHIYVLNQQPNGRICGLFPDGAEPHQQIAAGAAVTIPPDSFRFTPPAGEENFYIIASPSELDWTNPAQAIGAPMGVPDAKSLNQLARWVESRTHSEKSVKDLFGESAAESPVRGKDIVLMPPPVDGGYDVLHTSPERDDKQPFLVHVVLRHQP